MKNALLFSILQILLFLSNSLIAQTFYNHYPSALALENQTYVIEINSEMYKIETEFNTSVSFHQNIRIIKTDINGNVIWAKQYDAGTGNSLKAGQVIKSYDNKLILSVGLSGDNTFPYYSMIMKIDTNGNLIWQRKLGDLIWIDNDVIFQIPNSTSIILGTSLFESGIGYVPRVCKLDANGNILITQRINTPYNYLKSCAFYNNELSFVMGNVFFKSDSSLNIINQKTYNTESNLMHNVTSNGDFIFVSGVRSGGFGNGEMRVFSTSSAGTLLWSKNVKAWKDFIVHNFWTRFDFTFASQIFEDNLGNIIVNHYGEELNPNNVIIQFDAIGNYLTANLMSANKVWQCTDFDYLFAENHLSDYFGKADLNLVSSCHPLVDVLISNGTDSISAVIPTYVTSTEVYNSTNYLINQNNTTIFPTIYCNLPVGINNSIHKNKLKICPNPTQNILRIDIDGVLNNETAQIYNILGVIIKEFKIRETTTIDISTFSAGVYYLKLKTSNETYKLIKQ